MEYRSCLIRLSLMVALKIGLKGEMILPVNSVGGENLKV
jgi:hypothetical protein